MQDALDADVEIVVDGTFVHGAEAAVAYVRNQSGRFPDRRWTDVRVLAEIH